MRWGWGQTCRLTGRGGEEERRRGEHKIMSLGDAHTTLHMHKKADTHTQVYSHKRLFTDTDTYLSRDIAFIKDERRKEEELFYR